MNGYVLYFSCLIFVIMLCLTSSLKISEKNYRRVQRRKLMGKLYNKHKKKFKSGWKHTLEKVNIISDLVGAQIISVNEINGKEICEINHVDITKVHIKPPELQDNPNTLTNRGVVEGGCCCNPIISANQCAGPVIDTQQKYYGSEFWSPPMVTNWIEAATSKAAPVSAYADDDATNLAAGYFKVGRECEQANVNYETNNYYEIDLHFEGQGYASNTGFSPPSGTTAGTPGHPTQGAPKVASYIWDVAGLAVTTDPDDGDACQDSQVNAPTLNYVVSVKTLKKKTIKTSQNPDSRGGLIKSEVLENFDEYNDSPYGGSCTTVTGDQYPYVEVGQTWKEEIKLQRDNGKNLLRSPDLSFSLDSGFNALPIRIKAGDRITFKSTYGRQTDDTEVCCNGDSRLWFYTVGITYELGYYDTGGNWVVWKGQDWEGNFVEYANMGCESWWGFQSIGTKYPDGADADDLWTLANQYKEVCKNYEKKWMPMVIDEDIELQLRIKIPDWTQLQPFYTRLFGQGGPYVAVANGAGVQTLNYVNKDNQDVSASINTWSTQQSMLYLLGLRGHIREGGCSQNFVEFSNLEGSGNADKWSQGYPTGDLVAPSKKHIDFQKILIERPNYETFDVELDYPNDENHYFLVDVNMLAWRDSEGNIGECDAYTKQTNLAGCNDLQLDIISSELIETACLPNYFKNYEPNADGVFEGKCKLCITACDFSQYVDTTSCTGYGRETSEVCLTVKEGNFCPKDDEQPPTATAVNYNTMKQIPDCNGVCNGLDNDCPWMYGYVKIKNPWTDRTSSTVGSGNVINDCGYYCGKWRGNGKLRMDNGFPEFMFVPLNPDEPICRLLKGHEIISQCVNGAGSWDPTCTQGAAESSGTDDYTAPNLVGIMYRGSAINPAGAVAAYQTVLETLPHSETCIPPQDATSGDPWNLEKYNQWRSARSKQQTYKRVSA